MMENHWPKTKTAPEGVRKGAGGLSQAVEATEKIPGWPLYLGVVDRLSYGSLDTALVHVRMQQGMASHGELLLRMRVIGGRC